MGPFKRCLVDAKLKHVSDVIFSVLTLLKMILTEFIHFSFIHLFIPTNLTDTATCLRLQKWTRIKVK